MNGHAALIFLATLRLGTIPAESDAPTVSVRAEARAIAAESFLGPAALSGAPLVLNAHALASAPAQRGSALPAPLVQANRPEDWVWFVARELKLEDKAITRAALWVLACPVRVDLNSHQLGVSVRFTAF
ncbi:MAG TPA: hypothetical protein VMK12_09620 [Anaeromyxobacteraceae bacterium]|nr:hypothetical protein [Anaeromyxobacteraceae bacterium]